MTHETSPETVVPTKQESETPQGTERIKDRKVFVPLVDIIENEHALVLVADLPGVDEQGVDVTIDKNILTLKATVSGEAPAGYKLAYEEYGLGDYERSFTLSNEIDRDAVHAQLKDGVLKLTLPKIQQALARKVAVVAG
ncbi:MAG: Hsp20/alpha crystallin family protein [Planctomycetales bacterium]